MMRRSTLFAAGMLVAATAPGLAQEIPKPDYVTYMPREHPRAIARTDANARFHIYGDSAATGFRDENPKDGIDDRLNARYLTLAERFAPWLARNAYGFPTDVRRFFTATDDFPLVIDEFETARTSPRLVGSDSINLGRRGAGPCPEAEAAPAGIPDCRLRDLLRRRGPQAPAVFGPQGADSERTTVMYFNFPGAINWKVCPA